MRLGYAVHTAGELILCPFASRKNFTYDHRRGPTASSREEFRIKSLPAPVPFGVGRNGSRLREKAGIPLPRGGAEVPGIL